MTHKEMLEYHKKGEKEKKNIQKKKHLALAGEDAIIFFTHDAKSLIKMNINSPKI